MNNKNQNIKTLEEKSSYISNETTLLQFIKDNNIAEIDQIHNIHKYHIGGDRIGTIIEVQEKHKDNKTKIFIDLKQGQPTVNKVYDALYNIGKDCSIKIIMFTGGRNENDSIIPVADEYAVNSLIDQLQQSNVGILLCSVCGDMIKIEDHSIYDYWKQVDRAGKIDPPTEEQFMMQTFWSVYFDSYSEGFYEPWSAYEGALRDINAWGFLIYIDCIMKGEIQLFWDEDGVRYEVKQDDNSDGYLKRILDIDMPALKQRYGDNSVRFENVVGRLPRLFIQFSDVPFSWLYTATPKEITKFACKLHTDAWELRWQIEASVEKLFEPEPAAL